MSPAASLSATAIHFSAAGRPILGGVNLAVAPGERVGVIGPNGSGKSTLLRCLYAWHVPASGAVLLDGTDLATIAPSLRARAVAVLAQHTEAGLGLTVGEVVALGRLPHQRAWGRSGVDDASAVQDALGAVGLSAWYTRPFAPLSGGEKQQVLFARALAQRPTLLILDEPTNHLDIRHQLELLRAAQALGVSVVVTSARPQPGGALVRPAVLAGGGAYPDDRATGGGADAGADRRRVWRSGRPRHGPPHRTPPPVLLPRHSGMNAHDPHHLGRTVRAGRARRACPSLRAQTPAYPQEVQSCFDRVRFDAAPQRPVVNDFNMTQTVLDMGLAPRFVGFAGIQGGEKELVAAPGRRRRAEAVLGPLSDDGGGARAKTRTSTSRAGSTGSARRT